MGVRVMIQDITNACFELLATPFILLSIRRLYREKVVRGVSWVHIAFFSLWGVWNLYYYPHLGQWYSFVGGIGIVIFNSIWVGMMIRYSKGGKNE